MKTFEEFELAPVGSTATNDYPYWATKTHHTKRPWFVVGKDEWSTTLTNRDIQEWGFTLDSSRSEPENAREALALAWELAHPVKEGQVIPAGTDYLVNHKNSSPALPSGYGLTFSSWGESNIRTLEPLPDPEPDWLDAPAVLARVDGWSSCADPQVFARHDYHNAPSEWRYNGSEAYPWQELRDVTPLYPKEDA